MPLQPGTRFGSYEIVGPLGAGGMGEVYRARDARLGRDAAIKILPAAFINDADRVARFEREARTLASLNHPNIAQIYGMEENALVMELVEGEDLSAIIDRGAIPLADALPIARQIASALECAHDAGIVHRDLKPANVKVRTDGTVKVLDFGLARPGGANDASSISLANSPTMTSLPTEAGMILGTAAYMSPEQARGKVVDRRADVWAFGVVLYEMLTGRRAFPGSEVSDVLASVLKDTVPVEHVPAGTPSSIRRLLRRCLEKDRANRLDSMATARLEIGDAEAAKDDAPASTVATAPATRGSRALLATVVVLAVVCAGIAAFFAWREWQRPPAVPTAFALAPPGGPPLRLNVNQPDIAISRDGRRLAYSHGDVGATITVRSLDEPGDIVLSALGEQPRSPFFSPDNKWLGYFAAESSGLSARLMKVPLDGGAASQIAPVSGNLRGASWGRDDTIIFATTTAASGLWRVNAAGGEPEMLTKPDSESGELDHLWPFLMPDGKHVLFSINRRGDDLVRTDVRDVAVLELANRKITVIKRGASYPRFVSTGHLLYVTEQGLFSAPLDPASCELRGDAVRVMEGVAYKQTSGGADIDVSDAGTLIYIAGAGQDRSTLSWIERGTVTPIPAGQHIYQTVHLSPDRTRVALVITDDGSPTLWVYDMARETMSRLSPPGETGGSVVWSADGRNIYYGGSLKDKHGVVRVSSTGVGAAQFVIETTSAETRLSPSGLTADGRALVLTRSSTSGTQEIMLLNLDGVPELKPVLTERDRVSQGSLSPNGRWIAYVATENTIAEVFLRPYPNVGDDRVRVSTDGGRLPVWSADSRTLYFRFGGEGGVGRVAIGNGKNLTKPERVSTPEIAVPGTDYPTGTDRVLRLQRIVDAGKTNELRIVLNWFETLKQKVKK